MITKAWRQKFNKVCIQSSRTEQASEITMIPAYIIHGKQNNDTYK